MLAPSRSHRRRADTSARTRTCASRPSTRSTDPLTIPRTHCWTTSSHAASIALGSCSTSSSTLRSNPCAASWRSSAARVLPASILFPQLRSHAPRIRRSIRRGTGTGRVARDVKVGMVRSSPAPLLPAEIRVIPGISSMWTRDSPHTQGTVKTPQNRTSRDAPDTLRTLAIPLPPRPSEASRCT